MSQGSRLLDVCFLSQEDPPFLTFKKYSLFYDLKKKHLHIRSVYCLQTPVIYGCIIKTINQASSVQAQSQQWGAARILGCSAASLAFNYQMPVAYSPTPLLTVKYVTRHCQMSSGEVGKESPQIENHSSKLSFYPDFIISFHFCYPLVCFYDIESQDFCGFPLRSDCLSQVKKKNKVLISTDSLL